MKKQKKYNISRNKTYEILKKEILKYTISLHSETYGIEKINFDEIIDIEEILDLILKDERTGIRLLPYIDLTNISFKNQNITQINFTETNAQINPQTIKNKDFSYAILNGLDFKDCIWDGTKLCFTNFDGATNVDLDPQTVLYPSLYGCILKGIDFKGKSFKGVGLQHTDFRGAHNVIININEVYNKDLKTTLFDENATITSTDGKDIEEELEQIILKKILKQIPTRI